MECRKAMDLLSPYLDGELSAAEAGALETHLKACVTCHAEMEALRRISGALRAQADMAQAPPDFAARVMAQIEPRPVSWYTRWSGVWKPAVAAAAALALIAAGSLHMGWDALFTRDGAKVAENPSQPQVTQPGPQTPESPVVPATEDPGLATDPPVTDKADKAGPDTPAAKSDAPGKTETPAAKPDTRVTGAKSPTNAPRYEPRAFLSKQRVVSSTFLKVQVGDVRTALDQAFSLGGTYGAEFQPIQRISNGEIEVVRLTVGREQADVLTGRLAGLGRVISRDTETKDITGQFNRTREQYQTLLAKRDAATDAEEQAGMDVTLRSLEGQLTEWDREAERYVIVMWLQP